MEVDEDGIVFGLGLSTFRDGCVESAECLFGMAETFALTSIVFLTLSMNSMC